MSSQVLSGLYGAISTSLYDELQTKQATLYTFIGNVDGFQGGEASRVTPVDTLEYERYIRDKMVYAKKIPMSDISYAIPRINWSTGIVYDQYDDGYYGGSIIDVNVTNGGSGYTQANTSAYAVGGEGSGSILSVSVINGEVVAIGITQSGVGYSSTPVITIVGDGIGATATATISAVNLSNSGKSKLKDCNFYVLTEEFNVYKCLFNNLNAPSTARPIHTTVDPYETVDGYVWKFMYHIPLGLRKKFLTSSFMPVYNLSTSSHYNNGGIDYVEVVDGGTGYNTATPITGMICGNGYGGKFTVKTNQFNEISSFDIIDEGDGYLPNSIYQIKSILRSGTTVTCVTTTAHQLLVGRSVTIAGTGLTAALIGTFTVASVVDKNTFTYTTTSSGTISIYNGAVCSLPSSATLNITSITRVSNTVTVTTSVAHNLGNYMCITISGVTGFDGTYFIHEVPTTTTFIITSFGNDTTVLSTGTVSQAALGISNITRSTNVTTVTTRHAHNFYSPIGISIITRVSNVVTIDMGRDEAFYVGDTINIEGTVAFNGTFTVATVIDANTITFNAVGANSSETNAGVIYCQVVIENSPVSSFNGTFNVYSVFDPYLFSYLQTAADDNTYVNKTAAITTIPSIDETSALTGYGKYGTNAYPVFVLTPNQKDGIDYTVVPDMYIKGTTGTGADAYFTALSNGSVTTYVFNAYGSGYTTNPKVYIKGGTPHQAVVTANIVSGQVTSYTVNSGGFGYKEAPEIIIKVDAGTAPTATATVVDGVVTAVTPVTYGIGITTADVYFWGGKNDYVVQAKAHIWRGIVQKINFASTVNQVGVRDPGIKFSNGEIASITATGDGVGAKFTPHVVNGSIESVTIDNAGEGYTYIDLSVTGDTGTGAKLNGVVSNSTILGQVNTSQFDVELLAADGAISAIVVESIGNNTTSKLVTITGNGTGATAYGYVDSNSKMTKIKITNPGRGYTHATASFNGDSGYTLRVVIAPIGGHGSNAIAELFGDKLMTYSKISTADLYKNFGINSQFYQYGLISNPRKYTTKRLASTQLTSPCYKVTGDAAILHSQFPIGKDMYITDSTKTYWYKVVEHLTPLAASSVSILVQDTDNHLLEVGDVLTTALGHTINVTIVELPDIDKMTGTIIDVTNVTSPFYRTTSQVISLRTIISL